MKHNIIYTSDCLEQLKLLPDNSIDSIVTDPPYGISFMGKKWDDDIPRIEIWKECLRVLKPGGHLLSFGGTRTYHHIASSIAAAGFEIRDCISWLYGQGFPKSHNVGNGWGTQLKPAHELICVARKPLEGTVAQNMRKFKTGGINIDGCRVPTTEALSINRLESWSGFGQKKRPKYERITTHSKTARAAEGKGIYGGYGKMETHQTKGQALGRFPANIIHDGSDEVLEHFPDNAGGGHWAKAKVTGYGKFGGGKSTYQGVGEKDGFGSAARFFYCAKASRRERDFGLEGKKKSIRGRDGGQDTRNVPHKTRTTPIGNLHPTVKPLELMRYLVRLVTPRNGIVLDPFVGSGTTAIAATLEGFRYIGIEREGEYASLARRRIEARKWKTPSSRRSRKRSSGE